MRFFNCSGVSFFGLGGLAFAADLVAFVGAFFVRDEVAAFFGREAGAERFLRVEV